MREIKALTSLRGLFAMWVILYHLRILHFGPTPDPFGILSRGYLAVDFFFLLSGFVLASAYGSRPMGWPDYRRFAIKRAGRMFPLHLAVLAVLCFLAWLDGNPFSGVQIIEESLLIHRWPGIPAAEHAINGPAWSISAEWLVNLMLPVLVIPTLSRSRGVAIAMAIIAASVIVGLDVSHRGSLDIAGANSAGPFLRCVAEFMAGMLLFRYLDVARAVSPIAKFGLYGCAIVALPEGAPDFVMVGLMALCLWALATDAGPLASALSWRPLYGLGVISFSVYLVHEPVLRIARPLVQEVPVGQGWQVALFFAATIGITLLLSTVTYFLIERPARDLSKMIANQYWRASQVSQSS
jgi:peptidoglycan/LPS O-acetylase OafA/YrhL